MTDIFKDPTKEMPSIDERPARSTMDMSETVNKAPPPGMERVQGRDVENVRRPRKGHGY